MIVCIWLTFLVTDMPKCPKYKRAQFGEMIETFLSDREPLKMVLQIIDIRHPPSKDDILMYDWLKHFDIPVCIVTTKADKIPKSKMGQAC